MNMNQDEIFDQRIGSLLEKVGDIEPLPLSPERMEALRTLLPAGARTVPRMRLEWRRVADTLWEALAVAYWTGLAMQTETAPLMRGGEDDPAKLRQASLALPRGELLMEIHSGEGREAKLIFSVKGQYAQEDNLSVEVSVDGNLVEVRPLEQKAEITLKGAGEVSVALYAGDEEISTLELDIGEAKDGDHGG